MITTIKLKKEKNDNYSKKYRVIKKRNLCLLIHTKSLKKKQTTTRKI